MSITSPAYDVRVRNGPYFLSSFDKAMASVVASWAPEAHSLFWLAPNTHPPLTAAKVIAWAGPDACPLLLVRDGCAEPLGYLELNLMPNEVTHFWMGHCVIRPEHRNAGLGRLMVELMLDEAFLRRGGERVSLVVFPDNAAAIRCYRRAGFVIEGEQIKYFYTTRRQHRLLRMTITRDAYRRARSVHPPTGVRPQGHPPVT